MKFEDEQFKKDLIDILNAKMPFEMIFRGEDGDPSSVKYLP